MLTVPTQISNPQDQVAHFLNQLIQLYQEAKLERLEVAKTYPVSDNGFSILCDTDPVNRISQATRKRNIGFATIQGFRKRSDPQVLSRP
jgi:hypothetical protein